MPQNVGCCHGKLVDIFVCVCVFDGGVIFKNVMMWECVFLNFVTL